MGDSMKGRVALVTGAASGIGRATSLVFAREGAKVMAVDLAEGPMQETVNLIVGGGGEASGMTADVSKAEEVHLMVSETVSRFGRIDAAFNNAGIHTGTRIPFHEYPEDEWDRVIGVNLKGVWLCIKYELPQMLVQGGGAIVNTSSVAGLVASSGDVGVYGKQARGGGADQERGDGLRPARYPCECSGAGRDHDADDGLDNGIE